MKKDNKKNWLKWLFKSSPVGYNDNQNESINSNGLSIYLNYNNNVKVRKFDYLFKNKFLSQKKFFMKDKIDVNQNDKIFKGNFKRIIIVNECLDKINSKEDYLDKIWTPKQKLKPIKQIKTANLLNLEPEDCFNQKRNSVYAFQLNDLDFLNILLEPNNCTICTNELNTPLEMMPCSHIFHLYCIQKWLSTKKFCPYCLKSFTKKQITKYNQHWKKRNWIH